MKCQLLWVSHACSGFMGGGQCSTQNPQCQGAGLPVVLPVRFIIGIYMEVPEPFPPSLRSAEKNHFSVLLTFFNLFFIDKETREMGIFYIFYSVKHNGLNSQR